MKKKPADTPVKAVPFIKWAGGKSQLLSQFDEYYPAELRSGKVKHYVEPFLGGGAVFFDIAQRYRIESAKLFDINPELVLLYNVVKTEPEKLIARLRKIEKEYHALAEADRKAFYYGMREAFNSKRSKIDFDQFSPNWIERAAQQIFLNRTCFNGLYRVNTKGDFNSPHGRYANPRICNAENLLACSAVLQRAEIKRLSYDAILPEIEKGAFVYFDPPYRPISRTAYFTSYSSFAFTDEQQKKLADIFRKLSRKAKLMLSNSDPKNEDPKDNFFDDLYHGFRIYRVHAGRMINAKGHKRGRISEVLITNYNRK